MTVGDVTLTLELAGAPPVDVDTALRPLTGVGYRFFTLAEAKDDEATRRKLYALVREGVERTPGFSGTFEDYEVFVDRIYVPSYRGHAESQFLAAFGDDWVGLSSFVRTSGTRGKFGLTAVTHAHRGLGLARALKRLALRYAQNVGVTVITTENHPENHPILELNQTLGFRR